MKTKDTEVRIGGKISESIANNQLNNVFGNETNKQGNSKHEIVSFENIGTLRSALTKKRVEMLKAIKKYKPGSIYELSQILKRDFKNVNEDVRLLARVGLIKLGKTDKDRRKIIPNIDYGRICLEIRL